MSLSHARGKLPMVIKLAWSTLGVLVTWGPFRESSSTRSIFYGAKRDPQERKINEENMFKKKREREREREREKKHLKRRKRKTTRRSASSTSSEISWPEMGPACCQSQGSSSASSPWPEKCSSSLGSVQRAMCFCYLR